MAYRPPVGELWEALAENRGPRDVIMFPLRLTPGAQKLVPSQRDLVTLTNIRSEELSKKSLQELRRRASLAQRRPQKREVTATQVVRDLSVVEYVKKAAKGLCALCDEPAPFKNKKGRPYLECHHIVRLADNGIDSIENAVALCANCHRKMHILDKKSDIEKLRSHVKQRDG